MTTKLEAGARLNDRGEAHTPWFVKVRRRRQRYEWLTRALDAIAGVLLLLSFTLLSGWAPALDFWIKSIALFVGSLCLVWILTDFFIRLCCWFSDYPEKLPRGFLEAFIRVSKCPLKASPNTTDVSGFYYRAVQTEDLRTFVELSEEAPTIFGAHPDLSSAERLELYTRWYNANPASFLLLEKHDQGGSKVVGGSIILPLTRRGTSELWNGRTQVLKFTSAHITTSLKSKHPNLLIDTWVISKAWQNKNQGYGRALVLKHISMLWDPNRQKKLTIYVEPDSRRMAKRLPEIGFSARVAQHSKFDLYRLEFPGDIAMGGLEKEFAKVVTRIGEFRNV